MKDKVAFMIDPNRELEFEYIKNATIISNINIKNISTQQLAFKVRTTAPKSYLVRPNQGILLPDETKVIQIVMNPTPEYPGEVTHRFLVQVLQTKLGPYHYSPQDFNGLWENSKGEALKAKLYVRIKDGKEKQAQNMEKNEKDSENMIKIDALKILKNEVEKLTEFNTELELKQNNFENKLKYLKDEIQREEGITQRLTVQSTSDNSNLYFIIALFLGILVGYVYPIR
ncbi:unnamed protein product [Blepharisma stoltei]|uniref:MSP domain-containing protein n=1 Tax=Blepharisma stoltei TaxID=1481888 RepID=A0AAU9JZB7_9CILI|nr:unnamed protein product [Blepharisma stoltei]